MYPMTRQEYVEYVSGTILGIIFKAETQRSNHQENLNTYYHEMVRFEGILSRDEFNCLARIVEKMMSEEKMHV